MPNAVIHPPTQELSAFALGKLPDAVAAAVARHLEICPACRKAIEKLPADSFVGKVRAARPSVSSLPARTGDNPKLPVIAAAPSPPPKDLPPELAQYSKYRFVRELGRGGMGVVYQAEQTLMGRTVAIKVINPSVLDHPDALPRFQSEVRAAARLDHPNIVRAHDAEQVGNMHLLVMEYVEGASLADLVAKKGPLSMTYACHYIRQAALGLQHAFEQGMVHRDIKPQNLMVNARGQVKVLDFGLARMRSERKAGGGLTQVDAFMGTPEYVSPEQATDARSADTRADIYSLGCTLFFLLAGRPPFQGDSVVKLIMAQIEKEAPALQEVRADVPAELSAVVARMLAKDPACRFQTPVEVAQALAAFVKAGTKRPSGISPPVSGVSSPERGTVIAADTSKIKAVLREVPAKTPAPEAPVKEAASVFAGLGEPVASAKKQGKPARKSAKPVAAAAQPSSKKKWLFGGGIGVGVLLLALLGMWASVVTVKTPNGTIVVENVPADAEVQVVGQTVTLTRKGDEVTVTAVREGPHKLKVVQGGREIWSSDVTVKLGGDPIRVNCPSVVASPRPPMPPPDTPEQPADAKNPDRVASSDDEKGFVPLFNGKDLIGWVVDSGDKNAWQVKGGELVVRGTKEDDCDKQGYLLSEKKYSDFILRFEFQQVGRKDATCGVALRAAPGETARDSISNYPRSFPFHMTVWLGEYPFPEVARTGSLWWSPDPALQPALIPDQMADLRKAGEWNEMEVEMRGQLLRFSLNGREVQNVMLNKTRPQGNPAPGLSRFTGRIGFMKRTGEVRFRNIKIKELPSSNTDDNSKDPHKGGAKRFPVGYTWPDQAEWMLDGDELVQRSVDRSRTIVFGDPDWEDYDFSLDAKMVEGRPGFVLVFRDNPPSKRYEFALDGANQQAYIRPTGEKWNDRSYHHAKAGQFVKNTWYHLEVRVRGQQYDAYIDGQQIFSFTGDDLPPKGRVGVVAWGTSCRFRNIVVKDPKGTILLEGLPELTESSVVRGSADANALNNASWEVVRSPGKQPQAYRDALAKAEKASTLAPADSNILNTLGVACYRAGEYARAVEILERSLSLKEKQHGSAPPADKAFLAMAHHQLAHAEQAGKYLERLQLHIKKGKGAITDESLAFVQEAEDLIEPGKRLRLLTIDVDAAKKTYDNAMRVARQKVTTAFGTAEKRLLATKMDAKERQRQINFLEIDLRAFKTKGQLPWSQSMRTVAIEYLRELKRLTALLASTRAYLTRRYRRSQESEKKVDQLLGSIDALLAPQVIGTWSCKGLNFPGSFVWKLYSNERVNDPNGDSTWSLEENGMTLRIHIPTAPGGVWIDSCDIGVAGRGFKAKNQSNGTYTATLAR